MVEANQRIAWCTFSAFPVSRIIKHRAKHFAVVIKDGSWKWRRQIYWENAFSLLFLLLLLYPQPHYYKMLHDYDIVKWREKRNDDGIEDDSILPSTSTNTCGCGRSDDESALRESRRNANKTKHVLMSLSRSWRQWFLVVGEFAGRSVGTHVSAWCAHFKILRFWHLQRRVVETFYYRFLASLEHTIYSTHISEWDEHV